MNAEIVEAIIIPNLASSKSDGVSAKANCPIKRDIVKPIPPSQDTPIM